MGNRFLLEYWKHTALNIGQVARDFRYFYYHPAADKIANDGSAKHYAWSAVFRAKSLGNNLFYSLIPPHWHHSRSELEAMHEGTSRQWFLHGYAPWSYPDPNR